MSLSTPIFTWTCACALPQASAAPNAAIPKRCLITFLLLLYSRLGRRLFAAIFPLDSEILVQLFKVGVQAGVQEPVDDAAVLHDVIAVGHCLGETEILFHQQDGESLLL